MDNIQNKIKELETRIERLESRQGVVQSQQVATSNFQNPTFSDALKKPGTQNVTVSQASVVSKHVINEGSGYGTSKLLGTVGIICFIFASILMIKMSLDSGWLTPGRQVGLSFFFGILLIVVGFFPGLEQKRYISLLPGAGIVVLNLAVHGGFFLHSLYSADMALGLMSGISALAIWLFSIWRMDFYVVAATVGTYLGTLFLGYRFENLVTLGSFILIWDTTFSVISVWLRSRLMVLTSSYFGLGIVALKGFGILEHEMLYTLIFIQVFQFFVFAGGVICYSIIHKQPLKEEESWSFLPLLLFFYGTEYWFIDKLNPVAAPWLGLGFGVLILLIYQLAATKVNKFLHSGQMVYLFCSIVFFHTFYINILPDEMKPLIGIVALLGMGFMSARLEYTGRHLGIGLAGAGIIPMGYMMALFGQGSHNDIVKFLNTAGYGLAVLIIAKILIGQKTSKTLVQQKHQSDFTNMILGSAHIQVLVALYRLTNLWTWPVSTSLVISLFWIIYAVTILFFGFKMKNGIWARSSLFVLAFCTFKIFIYDVTGAPTVARIVSLLVLGAALYGFGYLYRKVAIL